MPEFDRYTLGLAQRNQRIADHNRQVADQNRQVADHNRNAVDQWIAYADKLKAKLSTVERERDALRQQLEAMQARTAALDGLQDKMAAELAKVSPSNPLVSQEHRNIIIETALTMARAPQMQL
ncbi:hypothetical protein J8I87_03025 [Paraburkholderia sp. LEh10]|uniref:hypothetical protein n=1 Tax=Paraburkholderia sp. LEh10 TaxID=2821353 RepID=UPI001AE9526D|nr:hypothetical protein [Paraburkholderia sp. LEh10]MBP0588705.1 hypothetical protein [Paraburkholderia sp. LEh10]